VYKVILRDSAKHAEVNIKDWEKRVRGSLQLLKHAFPQGEWKIGQEFRQHASLQFLITASCLGLYTLTLTGPRQWLVRPFFTHVISYSKDEQKQECFLSTEEFSCQLKVP
jgi:hypothetical protein